MSIPSMRPLGFGHGLRTLPRAIGILFQHPRLLRWLVFPFFITLALDLIVFYFAYDYLAGYLMGWVPEGSWILGGLLRTLAKVVVAAAVLFALSFTFTFVYLTLSSPFQEFLSEEVESIVLGKPGDAPEGWGNTLKGIWFSIKENIILILLEIPLFFFGFTPLVGPIVLFLWNVLMLGYAFLHIPTGRRIQTFQEKSALTRKQLGAVMGLGFPISLLMFVPFANLLFLPAFVVAGTLLYLDMEGTKGVETEALQAMANG